jgi:hypothetical protein
LLEEESNEDNSKSYMEAISNINNNYLKDPLEEEKAKTRDFSDLVRMQS